MIKDKLASFLTTYVDPFCELSGRVPTDEELRKILGVVNDFASINGKMPESKDEINSILKQVVS